MNPKSIAKPWRLFPFGIGLSDPHPAHEELKLRIPGLRRLKPRTPSAATPKGIPHYQHWDRKETLANYKKQSEEDVVDDINSPLRWWIVCTLFPLLASTFGPMASAFNICAVTTGWRTVVAASSNESEGPHIADPTWLVAINAVSLGIAIVANLFLLAQMTGRIRFAIASPITIVGWYISGFIDIGLVIAAPKLLPLPTDQAAAFSQAYYYACFAGSLYVFLSMMLTCTAIGICVFHFSDEFKLSMSQRSLMLQTMMFLGYLLAAGAVYSRVESENYLDAVYFVNVTLFTIGFGDWSPKTRTGRALLFPMAIGGILFVGLIIANIRTLVLESCSRKITLRVVEKARIRALRKGDPDQGVVKLRGIKARRIDAATEHKRRQQEFEIMREILASAAIDNRRITLFVSATSFFLLWMLGAVVFWEAEGAVGGQNWTYFESLYFTYVSLLTIGYGDFYPQTNSSKPAFVFWSLIALPTLTVLIGSIGDVVTDFMNSFIIWMNKRSLRLSNAIQALKHTTIRLPFSASSAKTSDVELVGSGSLLHAAHAEAMSFLSTNPSSSSAAAPSSSILTHEQALEAYRPYIVLREIKSIQADMHRAPDKAYSYADWTRVLHLLDEDEASSAGHRLPGKRAHAAMDPSSPPVDEATQGWSWLGQESPLMSNDSEPKWLVDRLLEVLERELKRRGDRSILEKIGTT